MIQNKILIVEPDPTNASVVTKLLEINDISTFIVASGYRAFSELMEKPYDLVLCEFDLPDMQGIDLLKKVRASEKAFAISFVFFSELPDEEKIRAAMIQGADDFLSKPFSVANLINTIKARLKFGEMRMAYNTQELNNKWLSIISVNFDHEFLTPLYGILSAINLLENYPDQNLNIPECKELLHAILESGSRMVRNTRNLIMFSIISKHDNDLISNTVIEQFTIEEFMEAILKNVNNHAGLRDAQMEVLKPQGLTINVPGICLKIILEELIDNAIKYNNKELGEPKCAISQKNKSLKVVISNKLSDCDKFTLDDVKPFKKFHQDLSLNGFGLGLFITKEIAHTFGFSLKLIRDNSTLNVLLEVPNVIEK